VSGGQANDHPGPEPPEHGAPPRRAEPSWRNELGGVVRGPAVQAQNIHGNVHFGAITPAPEPPPSQLPPVPANFTGRSAELAAIDRFASEADPARRLAVVVIVGAGGLGKTSLVSYWLHSIGDRYQGGSLFADLSGHLLADAARPGDVVTAFLRALGVTPERIPLTVGERAALYRSVTAGRRMIVFLDNAASAAQVRVLLPGPGPATPHAASPERPSLVVVTTRWRITGLAVEGARFIELGPLDETSALDLFNTMIGTDRAAADVDGSRSVVRLCGGIPLAVCVTGARLAAHPRWPVSRIAGHLASDRDRLAALSLTDDLSVRAALDVSYRSLPAEAAQAYRLAALIPGPDFSPDLAAAAFANDEDHATDLLDALADASLLGEISQCRYGYHDLARLHARELADSESAADRQGVITRCVTWYLSHAVIADLVVSPSRWRLNPMYERARRSRPGYASTAEALAWLDARLPGLVAAVQAAHDEGLHQQAWQLCEAMWGLFAYRKCFEYWIGTHVLGLASAQACGDRRAEARMRLQLGCAYLSLGRHAEAEREFNEALAADRQSGHLLGEAAALEQIGLTHLAQSRPDDAVSAFTGARSIHQQIGRPRGIAMMTRHIGDAHRTAGRHEDAIRHLGEARRLLAALPDPYEEARALTSLGQTYMQAARVADATERLTEALAIMIRLGSRYEQSRVRVALADAAQQLDDRARARDHLEQALAVYSAIGAPEAAEVRRRLAELGSANNPGPGKPSP
jgi:tetratricopeptide (TPR) repeat protein